MNIEDELKKIHERNARVELDKAWEKSATRRSFIVSITYISAVAMLQSLGNSTPFLTALIPAGGYFISTLTLPLVRKVWTEKL